jgi:hypothetical protein
LSAFAVMMLVVCECRHISRPSLGKAPIRRRLAATTPQR